MLLATSKMIKDIDSFAIHGLGISEYELIGRAGAAVAAFVRERVKSGSVIVVLAGKGNNGADGYAAAARLLGDYDLCVYDVFGFGQRSEGGRRHLAEYASFGGKVYTLSIDDDFRAHMKTADCIIDAVFGTGFSGGVPSFLCELSKIIAQSDAKEKIAIDVPLGVNADNGCVTEDAAYVATATVSLSFLKPGLVSYPGKKYVGKLKNDNIGLQNDIILSHFDFKYHLMDAALASSLIPKREENSSKGSFGKLLVITGSQAYPGAAGLTLEAGLRGGAGLVTYLGERCLAESLLMRFPEAIYKTRPSFDKLQSADLGMILSEAEKHTAALIGSGCTDSEGLYLAVKKLLKSSEIPLVLDADAVNVLSKNREEASALIRGSKAAVILTPHPLEFARLIGASVAEVQSNRLALAVNYAREHRCILVLKGAATVVTDGTEVFINSSGSSALAKAGSGDVLAGFIASLAAWCSDPLRAAALAVYVHGCAADTLAGELSELGVTPSDLPREMARAVAGLKK